MRLDVALSTARAAVVEGPDSAVLIVQLTEGADRPVQLYGYDIWLGMQHYRSSSTRYGIYGTLRDVATCLSLCGLDADALDWRAIDVHACTCSTCKAFWLDHHVIPQGVTWCERLWYRLRWLPDDVSSWFRCWRGLRWPKGQWVEVFPNYVSVRAK